LYKALQHVVTITRQPCRINPLSGDALIEDMCILKMSRGEERREGESRRDNSNITSRGSDFPASPWKGKSQHHPRAQVNSRATRQTHQDTVLLVYRTQFPRANLPPAQPCPHPHVQARSTN